MCGKFDLRFEVEHTWTHIFRKRIVINFGLCNFHYAYKELQGRISFSIYRHHPIPTSRVLYT